MTENEAIGYFKMATDEVGNEEFSDVYKEMCKMAIQALEEIKRYRAIGTVEQLRTMFDEFWKLKDLCEEYEKYGLPEDYWKLNEMCKEYSAIGTVEEFKRAKEMEAVYGQVKWERDIAISQLEEMGVGLGQKMDEFKALKEKNEPRKPISNNPKINEFYVKEAKLCPKCHSYINNCSGDYCRDCGQKLDWYR